MVVVIYYVWYICFWRAQLISKNSLDLVFHRYPGSYLFSTYVNLHLGFLYTVVHFVCPICGLCYLQIWSLDVPLYCTYTLLARLWTRHFILCACVGDEFC
jgi:hypothetical protein